MAQQAFFTNQPVQFARMDMQAATAPGRYIAQGIQQAAQGISQGLEKYEAKRKEKEQKEAAYQLFEQNLPMLEQQGIAVPGDAKERKKMFDAIGYEPIMRFADYTQRAKQQEQQMRNQQMQAQAMEAAAQRQAAEDAAAATERGAFGAGLAPQEGEDPIDAYARARGADPQNVGALLAVGRSRTPARKPEVLELPGGVRGVWDGNNFSRLPSADAPLETPQVKEVEGKKFYRGAGDADWKPLGEGSAVRTSEAAIYAEQDRQNQMARLQKELAESRAAMAAGRGDEKEGGFLGWGGKTHRERAMSAAMQLDSMAGGGQAPGATASATLPESAEPAPTRAQILEEMKRRGLTP